ncbi:MAG: hypothetical protein ACYC8T_01745 [Myxococcaceae bacterium]
MMKFIVISPQLVCCVDRDGGFCTLDEVPKYIGKQKGPLLFAIVPQWVGRVLGTERTIDSAMAHQFPGENSFSFEPIEANVYQVYVAPDELLTKLRSMGRDVRVVPYPAAVRAAIGGQKRQEQRFLERTRVFLAGATAPEASAGGPERVAIDSFGDGFLVTALRGREILLVRFAQGGDPAIELQRSLAGTRMENPVILTKDNDLAMELKVQGFNAELAEFPETLFGEQGLDKVLSLRFLNEMEAAQVRLLEGRKRVVGGLGASAALAALAAGAFLFLRGTQALAESEGAELAQKKATVLVQLAALYQERYASLARKESLQIREELYDLSISLPPQVALLSVEKSATGLSAVVERRPGAAPFSREDLRSALAASPFFADVTIREEYEGHVVRYVLNKPLVPPLVPMPLPAAANPP